MRIELRESHDLIDHVGRIVEHDHATGAEHRAFSDDALVIEQAVLGLFASEDRHRRAAGDARFQRPAGGRTAAHVVDQILERETERDFVIAGPLHVAAHREELGPCALGIRQAQRFVPGRAALDDVGDGRKRLDVVDRGREAEQSGGRRERRLDPGIAALALDRIHERGLFAADVGARAAMQIDLDRAEHARRIGLGQRALHDRPRLGELAADVDVGNLRANRVRSDRCAFEQRVWGPAHDLAVLERARLGFVRVDAEIVRLLFLFRHERPLEPGRESRAAPAAQP